ncbi:uncharacterized protein LOC123869391 isoform X1 [Maniola jurtina]|uniref:uncharacterized protein LOC123869391 isoform X1 n=1 Tax=Maniola jurtina TaxID=191418 RepID=UPI001E68A2AA|nr:uncharacterized protein LOC123869391 isoform X1 [Maniola jurtina]XP_045768246.1 uncharacterized protein LOC123869391 isoform X1 [Maniola jurtina]XP_045768247.1 uncharacterized protein LOC123869391 isoform X1 [Maniola jurtina]
MMPEGVKIPQSASPLARAGAGDSSAERGSLHATPLKRVHPAHPKKQLFSAPVNKFTAKPCAPSPNLVRIRSCLEKYRSTPVRPAKIAPKAVSMEDLTPTKRIKKDSCAPIVRIESHSDMIAIATMKESKLATVHSPGLRSLPEEEAAARIGRFMLVVAWRRRRDEIRCLRKTLESQVSCSERLRIQVCVLKSLLDSDNAKMRFAMRELDRLKNLLKDRDAEKAVLEKEKYALEQDVSSAEDRASEMSIGWRNCRNELESLRAAHACLEQALSLERAASQEARAHADRAFERLSSLEEELSQHEALLASAQAQAAALRRDHDDKLRQLERATEQLEMVKVARERCSRERSVLSARASQSAQQASALRGVVEELRAQLRRVELELKTTREQLDWWPRPLTNMLGAARSWFRHPLSIPEAVLWSFIPARHGC